MSPATKGETAVSCLANGALPPARKAQLLAWCDALLNEDWLQEDERALVKRMRSQLASVIQFSITADRQAKLAALVSRIKPLGSVH